MKKMKKRKGSMGEDLGAVREAWEGSVKVTLRRDLYERKQPDIQSSSTNLVLCPTSAPHPHIWYVLDLIIIVK